MDHSADITFLRTFLRSYIETYEELEILLLLQQSEERRTVASIESELNIEADVLKHALERLLASELIEAAPGSRGLLFWYSPGTPELRENVRLLAVAHRDYRVIVIEAMTANAIDRLRTHAIGTFAERFRLGGSKKNG